MSAAPRVQRQGARDVSFPAAHSHLHDTLQVLIRFFY